MSSNGRRAVVTGAAGVIGEATCRQLLAEGYRVVAVDLDKDAGAGLLERLGAGDQLGFETADVTVEADVAAYVQAAVSRLGGIDGFFNNAGIEGKVAPIVATAVEDFERVQAVNVRGVFLGCKHVMAVMTEGGGGSIVNTASVAGLRGSPGVAPYVTSKHAVVGLTKCAALEGAVAGIRVNAVCPGPVESRMMSSLEDGMDVLSGATPGSTREGFLPALPAGRYAKPEEVARLVAYLLSEASQYISGAAFPIDSGMTAH